MNSPIPAGADMPHSIRVACASDGAGMLDGHFGSCDSFLIYQVSAEEAHPIACRQVHEDAGGGDKNAHRISLIADCQLLFVASIGGPAAAKVVRAGIHPIKRPAAVPAQAEMDALCRAIGRGAAPWLAKAMGQTPEERVRFRWQTLEEGDAA